MDSNRNHQLRVGLFIFLGLVAVLASILALGGNKSLFKSFVTLRVQMDQVQGLNEGSVVSVTGIPVGNVREISFSEEKKSLVVEMKVDKRFLGRITKGSTAEIRTQGALGDKFVYITPGDPKEQVLKDGDFLETAPNTDLMGILSERGGEASKVFEIIDEIHKLAKTINKDGRSEKIIENLTETTASLKVTANEAKQLIAELRGQNPAKIREAIEKLNSILAKVDSGEGTLGALINDSSLHDQLKSFLGGDQRKKYMKSIIRSSIEKSEQK